MIGITSAPTTLPTDHNPISILQNYNGKQGLGSHMLGNYITLSHKLSTINPPIDHLAIHIHNRGNLIAGPNLPAIIIQCIGIKPRPARDDVAVIS